MTVPVSFKRTNKIQELNIEKLMKRDRNKGGQFFLSFFLVQTLRILPVKKWGTFFEFQIDWEQIDLYSYLAWSRKSIYSRIRVPMAKPNIFQIHLVLYNPEYIKCTKNTDDCINSIWTFGYYVVSDFPCLSVFLFGVGDNVSSPLSCGKTITGAAGIVSQRSFNKLMNLLTISWRNFSSRVNKSKRKKARMYLKGTMRRVVAEINSTRPTSVVIYKKFTHGN